MPKCEIRKHELSSNHITVYDEHLFHRVFYFCSWNCFRTWFKNNAFPIKKESIFAFDLPNISIKTPNTFVEIAPSEHNKSMQRNLMEISEK